MSTKDRCSPGGICIVGVKDREDFGRGRASKGWMMENNKNQNTRPTERFYEPGMGTRVGRKHWG